MASRNLLVNSTFDGSGGWRFDGAARIVSGGFSGTKCLQIDDSDAYYPPRAYQEVHLVRGQSYTLSFYAKATGPQLGLSLVIRYLKSGMTGVYWRTYDLITEPSEAFLFKSINFTMPHDTATTLVEFSVRGKGWTGYSGTYWIDNIQCIGDDGAATNPQYPSYPALPSGSNRVLNGTFENGGTNWTLGAGTSVVSSEAMEGQNSLKLKNTSGSWRITAMQSLELKPGAQYTLSLWIKAYGDIDVWSSVNYTQNGSETGFGTQSLRYRLYQKYIRYDKTFVYPLDATNPRIYIWAGSLQNAQCEAYVDDVRVIGPEPDPGPSPTGKKYISVNANDTRVYKKNDTSQRWGFWPQNRRDIVDEYNSTYYETTWATNSALIRKDAVTPTGVALHEYYPDRMLYLVEPELGRSNSEYYDGATGSWCQSFLNWLMLHAGYPKDSFPYNQSGTGYAICDWVNNSFGDRFYWKRAETKASMRSDSRYSASLRNLTDELTARDVDYMPVKYDFVYFKWTGSSIDDNVNHVGWIYNVDTSNIYTWEGNGTGGKVVKQTYPINDTQIVGFSHPEWYPMG